MIAVVMKRVTPLLENKRAVMGVLSVLVLMATVFPPASLGAMLIMWMYRNDIVEGFSKALEPQRRWVLWLPAVIVVAFTVFKGGSSLPDDLNRHLTSYLHGYDYSGWYLYSDPRTPHSSMWIGFEWLVGHFHLWFGLFWATQLMQALAFTWVIWLFTVLFLRLLQDHPERMLMTALGVTAVLYSGVLARVQAGRPEVFLSMLAISALLATSKPKVVLWTLLMLAAQPLYWLAAVYAPSALLLPNRSWPVRMAIAALIAIFGIAAWIFYAGPEWYGFFALLKDWFGNRVFRVSENNSIYQLMFVPGSLILVLVALMFSERQDFTKNLPVLLVMAWFLAPNQVRYASVVGPLIAVIAVRGINAHPFTMSAAQRFIAVAAMVGILIGRMYGPGYDFSPTFDTLKGDERVLTMFEQSTFFLPAQYPGLRVAPHLEAGATEKGVQEILISTIRNRKMDCEKLALYPDFTHVVDRNIEEIAPCLELQEMHREWRLWRIKTPEAAK